MCSRAGTDDGREVDDAAHRVDARTTAPLARNQVLVGYCRLPRTRRRTTDTLQLGRRTSYFSSQTRSSIGQVIFTLLPVTSTAASRPVVECPVDRMKNLSVA